MPQSDAGPRSFVYPFVKLTSGRIFDAVLAITVILAALAAAWLILTA